MTGSASFSGTHPSLSLSSLSRGERAFERESERVIDDDERRQKKKAQKTTRTREKFPETT